MDISQNLRLSLLCEVYSPLLTVKQQNVLKGYLDNNLSLSELAVVYATTRQAINDLLKRTFSVLEEYEQKLGLLKKFEEIRSLTQALSSQLQQEKVDKKSLQKIVAKITENL